MTKQKINLPFKSWPRKEFGFLLDFQGETGGGGGDGAVFAFAYWCFLKQAFGWAFVEFNLHAAISYISFQYLEQEIDKRKRKNHKSRVICCSLLFWAITVFYEIRKCSLGNILHTER